ncbi:MAG: ABC transporter ATP-binding protein [Clostridia bacterium]|nr:ABC transporter ATP-binding protein [Clostridia bacterium]
MPEADSKNTFKQKKFPDYINTALEKCGLKTQDLIYSVLLDMTPDGDFADCFLCFDKQGLYIADGSVEVPSKKGRPCTAQVEKINAFPNEEIEELSLERYVSTARLTAKSGDDTVPIAMLSYRCLAEVDRFIYVYNAFCEGKDISELPELAGDKPPEEEKKKTKGIVFRLLSFYKKYIPMVLLVTAAIIVCTAFQVWAPQIGTRALFDNVISNPDKLGLPELIRALGILTAEVFAVKLFHVMLESGHEFLMASITPKVVYDIKIRIFTAMQRQSVSYYTSKQTGSLMKRVTRDSINIYWFLINDLPEIFVNIVMITGILVIMFRMNTRLSLLVLVITPLLGALIKLTDRMFHRMHHSRWVHDSDVSSMVSDNINGQRVIKAFCRENHEHERFSEASSKLQYAEQKLATGEATVFPLFQALIHAVSTVIFAWGSVMVVRGELTVGILLSFIVYVEMIQQPVNFLSGVVNRWARCMDSAQRVFEIIDSKPEITEKENAVSMDNMRGEIDIKELEFEYEPARPILKKLNLHVEAGEMLGIVGKTGAGKTTIASLIARLYDPKRGCVEIDGVDVRDIRLGEIHRNVGMVSQDIFLFMGTIADNIRYANPSASMHEVIAAAKAAAAHDFIMKLPDAYETRVGSGGRDLSGGERQRISIARTIIQNPKILILDEATAAMDTETEGKIQKSVSELKQGRTTIAIAHRLSTLRESDHLAVIDNGNITEYGTYDDLLEQKGQFYNLYTIQNDALNAIGIGE